MISDSELYDILDRFEWVREYGGQWRAKCPAHDTHHRSLVVAVGERGILFYCYAGCSQEQILDAVGLTWQDVFYCDQEAPLILSPRVKRNRSRAPGRYMTREEIEFEHDFGTMPDWEYLERILNWQGRRTLVEFDDQGEITSYALLKYEQSGTCAEGVALPSARSGNTWPGYNGSAPLS